MKTDYLSMPDELPETLTGKNWKKKLLMHLNLGRKEGGICSYEIFDENDRSMPFAYQSSSKQGTGFLLPGVKPLMSWKELREIWPIWIKRARDKQTSRSLPTTPQQPARVTVPGGNEHFTKGTLEVTAYCGRCGTRTQHRVDNGRRGPCLDCLKKREIEAEANRIKRGMDKEQAEEYDRQNPKLF